MFLILQHNPSNICFVRGEKKSNKVFFTIIFATLFVIIPSNSFLFFLLFFIIQVSASDPDCGVNAMVNYTLGDGFKKMMEFEVKHTTGDICISGTLDYETRSSYEFPIIATDQGKKKEI